VEGTSIRDVTFYMEDGSGFPLRDALDKSYSGLVRRDENFTPLSSSVNLRIEVRKTR
jgi:hypothetical protein